MEYNLEQGQFEIIEKAIKYLLTTRKGIVSFLNERGQVIDLEDEISVPDLRYRQDLENGDIGIKSLPFHKPGVKIQRVALIKMNLKINTGLLKRRLKNGTQGMILHDLRIYNDIKYFLDQKEQFILRGIKTKNEFAINDLGKNEVFNCFFQVQDKRDRIRLFNFKDLHDAVVNLTYNVRKVHYNPPFTLMSDSKTLKWSQSKHFETPNGIVSYKEKIEERREIDNWIDLYDNADNSKGNDHSLVVIAFNEYFNNTFRIIEKSPLNLVNTYEGIVLFWCGALEIKNRNAIQSIKIDF